MRPMFIIEYDYTDTHSSIKHITKIFRMYYLICSDIYMYCDCHRDDNNSTCSIHINV